MATRPELNALWDAAEIIHRYYEDLFRPVAQAFNLTTGQLKVLHTLHRFGTLTVGDLASVVGMARTNMSSLCKKLSKQGFLIRHRGADGDERQVLVELTPEGESAARQAEGQFDLAHPALRNGDLTELSDALILLAQELYEEPAETKTKRSMTATALHVIKTAKNAFMGEKPKKELQHGKD